MKKEEFDIFITGIQHYSDSQEKMDIQTAGHYYLKNKKRYIEYREYEENNPSSFHHVTLEIDGEKAMMSHENTATRLILEKGRRYLCAYETDFGIMQLGISTRSFSSTLDDNGGELHILYTLDVDSRLSSTNEIQIKVKRRSNVSHSAPAKPQEELDS